jgi:S-DNA-T family DNA segregation ATPase FtsK/SpoIIIE
MAVDKEDASYFKINKYSKIFGVLLATISILLFFCICSYLFSFKQDQSIAIEGWEQIKNTESYKIKNWVNKIGLYFGYVFADVLFGVFSLLIPMSLLGISVNFIFNRKLFSILKLIGYPMILIILGCSFVSLFQSVFTPNTSYTLGGGVGQFLASETGAVQQMIGKLGVFALWIASVVVCLVWFFDFAIEEVISLKFLTRLMPKKSKSSDPNYDEEQDNHEKGEKNYHDTLFEMDGIDLTSTTKDDSLTKMMEFPSSMSDSEDSNIQGKEIQLEIEERANTEEVVMIQKPYIPTIQVVESIDDIHELEIITPSEEAMIDDIEELHNNQVANLPPYDPRKDLENYKFPSIDLLEDHGSGKTIIDKDQLERNKKQIVETLQNFQISISSIKATVGPTVTLYEITPSAGVRISKIKNLSDDIALSLSALGIRIIAPIPGRDTIGIEVPNLNKEIVSMRSMIQSEKFQKAQMELPLALGKSISNEIYVADLTRMPHLLMAGATGKGKSVGINSILISLLYKKHPAELKFVLVDPKKVELSIYSAIEKHFLAKLPDEEDAIITDVKKVVKTLNSLCIEMDERYDLLKKAKVRTIKEYNQKFKARQLNPNNGHKFMPYIVLVIDEFADLIMTAGKEVEMPIARLAQLARAIGIHLIIATQRPSVNIITGMIKANFPARISFAVSSAIDSKTILDQSGAEKLIGQGDMLVSHNSEVIRLQCGFIDTPEVDQISEFISNQQSYPSAFDLPEYIGPDEEGTTLKFDAKDIDDQFENAAREVVLSQMGSISLIQRKLSLGHNRAGRIMDQLEAAGIVGPTLGSKPREVYFKTLDELENQLETLRKW